MFYILHASFRRERRRYTFRTEEIAVEAALNLEYILGFCCQVERVQKRS